MYIYDIANQETLASVLSSSVGGRRHGTSAAGQ